MHTFAYICSGCFKDIESASSIQYCPNSECSSKLRYIGIIDPDDGDDYDYSEIISDQLPTMSEFNSADLLTTVNDIYHPAQQPSSSRITDSPDQSNNYCNYPYSQSQSQIQPPFLIGNANQPPRLSPGGQSQGQLHYKNQNQSQVQYQNQALNQGQFLYQQQNLVPLQAPQASYVNVNPGASTSNLGYGVNGQNLVWIPTTTAAPVQVQQQPPHPASLLRYGNAPNAPQLGFNFGVNYNVPLGTQNPNYYPGTNSTMPLYFIPYQTTTTNPGSGWGGAASTSTYCSSFIQANQTQRVALY